MVRRYVPTDFNEVHAWGAMVGETYEPDLFPSIGFIVPGIAVYFLYTTDSKVCFMESLVSNITIDKEKRDVAIKAIIFCILTEARHLGYKMAYACSNIDAVTDRAKTYGAITYPGYTLLQKRLD